MFRCEGVCVCDGVCVCASLYVRVPVVSILVHVFSKCKCEGVCANKNLLAPLCFLLGEMYVMLFIIRSYILYGEGISFSLSVCVCVCVSSIFCPIIDLRC